MTEPTFQQPGWKPPQHRDAWRPANPHPITDDETLEALYQDFLHDNGRDRWRLVRGMLWGLLLLFTAAGLVYVAVLASTRMTP